MVDRQEIRTLIREYRCDYKQEAISKATVTQSQCYDGRTQLARGGVEQ